MQQQSVGASDGSKKPVFVLALMVVLPWGGYNVSSRGSFPLCSPEAKSMDRWNRSIRKYRLLVCERFEARWCLSVVGFVSQDIPYEVDAEFTATPFPRDVKWADLDGDGDLDVLSASSGEAPIAWYENVDGDGVFGKQQVISSTAASPFSVFPADVDGDGDLDVLSAAMWDHEIAWYENTDGNGAFGRKQVIATNLWKPRSVFAADLDGDGDLDVLSTSMGNDDELPSKIEWYENIDGNATFRAGQIIAIDVDRSAASVYAGDLDGDGDMDVLSASRFDNKIAWYENTDGQGTFGGQRIITTSAEAAVSVSVADLDGDGDLDVLSASEGRPFQESTPSKIAWYENLDGNGAFGGQRIIATGRHGETTTRADDIDGDGDLDVVASISNRIVWFENVEGHGTFQQEHPIAEITAGIVRATDLGDVNGDGHVDVLAAIYAPGGVDVIGWYQNPQSQGSFGELREVVPKLADGAFSSYAADLDGDGDLDVIAALERDGMIVWYENDNVTSRGRFGERKVISHEAIGARSVFAIDLDRDGDLDVLSASYSDNKIAWYENTDGRGTFGEQQIITTDALGAQFVFASDLDGDGDADVLSASAGDNKLAWYENTDGRGTFGVENVISTNAIGAQVIVATDLNGDGDMDIVSASSGNNTIAWYENTDGGGSFGSRRLINVRAPGASFVQAGDLDGDGDVDVLSVAADNGKVTWHENRPLGDANGDGHFDSSDLVQVFAWGQYEDGIAANSGFAQGDWNGDGEFDSADFVAAFQAGTFEKRRAVKESKIAGIRSIAVKQGVPQKETCCDRLFAHTAFVA
jgi:hypothetical protein